MLTLFSILSVEAREAELKKLLEQKDEEIEEIRRRLRDQDRERQSELLKLQMEVRLQCAYKHSYRSFNWNTVLFPVYSTCTTGLIY